MICPWCEREFDAEEQFAGNECSLCAECEELMAMPDTSWMPVTCAIKEHDKERCHAAR